MGFSKDFVWGTATAAYQIEGAAYEDGRGLSVWDMMCRKQGAIYKGQDGSVACDHYHLFKTDVAIMKQIGVKAYRLSISWPRLIPTGTGQINQKAVEFYNNLINELLAAEITPYITLFHWDYPLELYCRGGWLNPESSDWFAQYTSVVMEYFSDRVKNWITLNEPQCFIGLGHCEGIHAPGDKLPLEEVLRAGHNAMLAHGKAVQVIRAEAKTKTNIGYAPVGDVRVPLTMDAKDVNAARISMFKVTEHGAESKVWNNTWWFDPIFLGKYPDDGVELYGSKMPKINSKDMDIISTPVDFCGANIYHARLVKQNDNGQIQEVDFGQGYPYTFYGWPVIPQSMYWGPKFYYERYKKPIMITENGMVNSDWISIDGKVHDPQRIDFLGRYLKELKLAADEVPVHGYFLWSLLDNFEWTMGYNQRFGLVYTDYNTQKRTLKDSAYWYSRIIAENGESL
ncbi:MAG: beta-glucosidase [Planctomycetes bacterium GWF2_41_51]|nr:MAG: beta-glucosidase [Planctomycetes bacterium GWF2_41_51]